jgi:hypothetical protein
MQRMTLRHSVTFALLTVTLAFSAGDSAHAQGAVYRCPGPVLTYTDQLTPAQAKDRGCKVVEGAPVTIVNSNRPRAGTSVTTASSGSARAATPSAAGGAGGADAKVSDAEQRNRDRDAKRILDEELARERDKLTAMKKEFNNGEPERQGGERNYQKYLDRVEEMRQAIARKESDINAIERERTRMPGAQRNDN